MKKLPTLLLALAATTLGAQAQTRMSCCASPHAKAKSTEVFARLGTKKDFVRQHDEPLPYHYTGEGKAIEFKTADGTMGKGFEIKADKRSTKYLFVFQEWWGLNDYIKKEAATYAAEMPGVNVIAVDLYDGKVATTRDEASAMMQAAKTDRIEAIIRGAQVYAGPKAEIATIGWCFGGGWSLQAALIGGKQTAGCVMYYGMPEKDVAKLKTLNSDVLGIFAKEDGWISPEVVKTFEADMAKAGKKVTVVSYNADHAFANPSNPKYSKEFAAEAHAKALGYLKRKLKA